MIKTTNINNISNIIPQQILHNLFSFEMDDTFTIIIIIIPEQYEKLNVSKMNHSLRKKNYKHRHITL